MENTMFPKVVSKHFKSLTAWLISSLTWIIYQILKRCSPKIRAKLIFFTLSFYWPYQKPKIKKNIRLILPDLDDAQIDWGSERLKKTTAQNIVAVLDKGFLNTEEEIEKLEVTGDLDSVLDLYCKGKKIIITVSHTGPYDKTFCFVPFVNRKLAPFKLELRVYVPAEEIKLIDTIMADRRKSFGDIIFEPVKKGKTLAKAKKYLNEGRVVFLTIDMLRKGNSGGVVCQIGEAEARFPVGAVKLALEEDAIIIPIFPSGGRKGKVRVEVGCPFEIIKTGDKKRDIEDNVRRLVEDIYAPFIQRHYYEWLQLPWSDLKLAKGLKHKV